MLKLVEIIGDIYVHPESQETLTHDACATRELSFKGVTVPAEQVHASYMAALGAVFAQVKGVDEILENMRATA